MINLDVVFWFTAIQRCAGLPEILGMRWSAQMMGDFGGKTLSGVTMSVWCRCESSLKPSPLCVKDIPSIKGFGGLLNSTLPWSKSLQWRTTLLDFKILLLQVTDSNPFSKIYWNLLMCIFCIGFSKGFESWGACHHPVLPSNLRFRSDGL